MVHHLTATAVHNYLYEEICEADFQVYVEALSKIVPWFFALDDIHYARWIPVHLYDLISLKEYHRSIYEQFRKGNFTLKKSEQLLLLIKHMNKIMHL